jgi:hypothetical protein
MTGQQLSRLYELYNDKEVTFTKDVVAALNLEPRQVFVKCADAQWPCIINSSSLSQAKIIIGVTSGAYSYLVKEKASVSLRFHFLQPKDPPISFFVNAKVANVAPFGDSNELVIVTLAFTQRPPDDLIEIIGAFIETAVNFASRKDERIPVNPETKRKLGLAREELAAQIQGVPRNCVLRDLCFGGARIILMGLQKFILDKEALLRLEFDDIGPLELRGRVVGTESVQDRRDIFVAVIRFDDGSIPMAFKMRLNSYITTLKKPQGAGDSVIPGITG